MTDNIKIKIRYDELFKVSMRYYFEPIAKVITDYEIIELPKKVDLLIIEADEPLEDYLEVMKYFRQFNVIEFKSENDKFDLNKDVYKLGIYMNGILLKEENANQDNTTFTLVSSRKLRKFLNKYNATKIRDGLYRIDNISIIPIYVIIISEIEVNLIKEITALKELTVSSEREIFFEELLNLYKIHPDEYSKYLALATSNYKNDMKKVREKIGDIDMNKLSKNMLAAIKAFKLDEEFYNQGIEQGLIKEKIENVRRGLENGLDIKTISIITGLDESEILKIKENMK